MAPEGTKGAITFRHWQTDEIINVVNFTSAAYLPRVNELVELPSADPELTTLYQVKRLVHFFEFAQSGVATAKLHSIKVWVLEFGSESVSVSPAESAPPAKKGAKGKKTGKRSR